MRSLSFWFKSAEEQILLLYYFSSSLVNPLYFIRTVHTYVYYDHSDHNIRPISSSLVDLSSLIFAFMVICFITSKINVLISSFYVTICLFVFLLRKYKCNFLLNTLPCVMKCFYFKIQMKKHNPHGTCFCTLNILISHIIHSTLVSGRQKKSQHFAALFPHCLQNAPA